MNGYKKSYSIECFVHEPFFQKMNYVHNNPVDAGIVEKPKHYMYSILKSWSHEQPDITERSPLVSSLSQRDGDAPSS